MKVHERFRTFADARYSAFLDQFRITVRDLDHHALRIKMRYHEKHGAQNWRWLTLFLIISLPGLAAEVFYLWGQPDSIPFWVIFGFSIFLWPIPVALLAMKIIRHRMKLKGYKRMRATQSFEYSGPSHVPLYTPAQI